MTAWSTPDARTLTSPEEVQVLTRRADGSLRSPTIIWIVSDGDDVFIRSTNGAAAAWFRNAVATGSGRVIARGESFEVTFTQVDDDLARVDDAYRAKYGQYGSIVDHLQQDDPRAATLQVHPA